jgi:hypothetical protein
MKEYPITTLTLDPDRAAEKVAVHFNGDASKMLSYNRTLLPVASADQIRSLRTALLEDMNSEDATIVGIHDRFAMPASSGYSDLKFLTRTKNPNFISMGRAVHIEYEISTFWDARELYWVILQASIAALISGGEVKLPCVLVTDNYLKDDDNSCLVVSGFPDGETASAYATHRIANSLQNLKGESFSTDHWVFNWITLGEDTCVLYENGTVFTSGPNIRPLMIELSVCSRTGYQEIDAQLSLSKRALLVN